MSAKKLQSLQPLRAMAAMVVVTYHLGRPLGHLGYTGAWPRALSSAVDIFFVISGFIVWVTTRSDSVSPKLFYWRRIVRIVPLYWLMTTIMLMVLLTAPSVMNISKFFLPHVIASYLFIPSINPGKPAMQPLLFAGWSLNYQMFFYAIFGALLLTKWRIRLVAIILIFVMLRLIGYVCSAPRLSILGFYSDGIIWEFLYGIIIGEIFYRNGDKMPFGRRFSTVLLVFGLFIHFGLPETSWPYDPRYGFTSAFLVAGALGLESAEWFRRVRIFRLLSDSSYSIYLSHEISMAAFLVFWRRTGLPVDTPSLFLFVSLDICIALGGGLACNYFVERPLISYFKKRDPGSKIAKPRWVKTSAEQPAVRATAGG